MIDTDKELIQILTSCERIPLEINDAEELIHILVLKLFSVLNTDIDPNTQTIGVLDIISDPNEQYGEVVRYTIRNSDEVITIYTKSPYIPCGCIMYDNKAPIEPLYFDTVSKLIILIHGGIKYIKKLK